MSRKDKLLENLRYDVYTRLRPSPLGGVGVFAIKDIPKGVDPFNTVKKVKHKPVKCTKNDIKNLDPGVKKMISDFFELEEDGGYYVPENGLNSLDITFYLNHSDNNNLDILTDDKDSDYCTFETTKKINKGEELLINYQDYK